MKISAVQFPIDGSLSEGAFLTKVEGYILEAKAAGANLVIFPELLVLDMVHSVPGQRETAELVTLAKEFTPRYFNWIQSKAKETGMMILGGSSPRWTGEDVVNTAIFAFPDREPVLQDKLNLTPDEKAWHWKNGNTLKVFETPYGKTVILICYDSQFTSVSTQLRDFRPDLFLVPSMTGKQGLNRVRWAAQARAVEHYAYVALTGTVEPLNPAGLEQVGQAVFIPPQDVAFPAILAEGPYNKPGVVTAELDVQLLQASKKTAGLFSSRDDLVRTGKVVVQDLCNKILK